MECFPRPCDNKNSRKRKAEPEKWKRYQAKLKRFPSDPVIASIWTEKIRLNRNDICWKPTKNTKICSLHFNDKDKYLTKGGLCRIRRDSVPSKNLPIFVMEEKLDVNVLSDDIQHKPNQPQPKADAGSLSRKASTPSADTHLPEAEKIIASVYRYLQSEYDNLKSSIGDACDLSPLENVLKRTAAATGVSERTVTDILEKGKRSTNSADDSVQNKRTKFIHTFEDDVSPIEEESSCGSPPDVEEPDEDEEEKEDQYDPTETIKVELEDEEEDHSEDLKKKIREDLATCEKTSVVHHLLSPAQTELKIESQDIGYQTSSAVHHLLSSTRVETQHEPSDVLHRQAGHAELQTAPDATLDPVKTEPLDDDTDT